MNTFQQQAFINLPVSDLPKAKAFYQALGFECNPQFTNELAACMVVSETIYVMLLTQNFFSGFVTKPIANTHEVTASLVALNCASRAAVDAMVQKALAAGGTSPKAPNDMGFMYQHGFQDLDGHVWEVFWMDETQG